MKHSIAVIHLDQAFATILKEGLETTGNYEVTPIYTGNVALDTIASRPFDMVIVDMGLEGMSPASLITGIRALRPSIRVMLIPISGNQIPEELRDFDIHGLLPKPFFVDDLPAIVQHAMYLDDAPPARPARAPDKAIASEQPASAVKAMAQAPEKRPVESASPPQPPAQSDEQAPAARPKPEAKPSPPLQKQGTTADNDRWLVRATPITRILQALNREIHAEAIMVTAGDQLIACAGSMDRERISQTSSLAAECVEIAGRLMGSLGKQGEHVEQSLSEGARHTIYTLRLTEELILTAVTSSSTPPGTLRYRARKAGEEIVDLL